MFLFFVAAVADRRVLMKDMSLSVEFDCWFDLSLSILLTMRTNDLFFSRYRTTNSSSNLTSPDGKIIEWNNLTRQNQQPCTKYDNDKFDWWKEHLSTVSLCARARTFLRSYPSFSCIGSIRLDLFCNETKRNFFGDLFMKDKQSEERANRITNYRELMITREDQLRRSPVSDNPSSLYTFFSDHCLEIFNEINLCY